MTTPTLVPITGVVRQISPVFNDCCSIEVTLESNQQISNFIVSSATYVIQGVRLRVGMRVISFYDASLPIPLIYPPRYQAIIIGLQPTGTTIYAGYFDDNLTSSDNTLRLMPSRTTEILSSTGQAFTCSISNQLLIVFYTASTRSIPAQTTPQKIIVLC